MLSYQLNTEDLRLSSFTQMYVIKSRHRSWDFSSPATGTTQHNLQAEFVSSPSSTTGLGVLPFLTAVRRCLPFRKGIAVLFVWEQHYLSLIFVWQGQTMSGSFRATWVSSKGTYLGHRNCLKDWNLGVGLSGKQLGDPQDSAWRDIF